jgi:hypothetical protein
VAIIYSFRSTGPAGLCAFAGDRQGSKLPARHGPWKSTGTIRESQPIPHRLDRAAVEESIDKVGFQLWRIKKPGA